MNMEAVALAADSAVAASSGHNQKVFVSQNKLFSLSDAAPVGILVYGDAAFMSIPWEVIVKEYRRVYGRVVLPALDDHVGHFCDFLSDHMSSHISVGHQTAYAADLVRMIYEEINGLIHDRYSEVLDEISTRGKGNVIRHSPDLLDELTAETVDYYYERAQRAQFVETLSEEHLDGIRHIASQVVPNIRNEIFDYGLSSEVSNRLDAIAVKAIGAMVDDLASQLTGVTTGIAIAGFGRSEIFPSYSHVDVEGIVAGALKVRVVDRTSVGPENRALIAPFAQDDMIYQFMQGIAPDYLDYLDKSMKSHLGKYTELLLDNMQHYSDAERTNIMQRLEPLHLDIADSFVKEVMEMGNIKYASETIAVVAMLPKEELAELAEALVSLTSLRRKVSLGDETVGGPTDVALITKGDGLVWVKRKHYFPAKLNPAFFARKYGGGGIDHATQDRNGQDN